MNRVLYIILLIFTFLQVNHAAGVLTSVYLNPVQGNDANEGSSVYPVRTWDRALSLAADNATIYFTGGAIFVTSNMSIDGNQYGASNITATPNTGYTGALFAIADNATGAFSNLTLKGTGMAQSLLSVNSRGTLTIGNDVRIIDMGEIALDGGAYPINLTATPPAGMSYLLATTFATAAEEGRAIVNAGTVASPLQYFTLVAPVSDASVDFGLRLDGTTIRLHELPKGGVYIDPLNGNDAYSGGRSNRAVKTLARAIAQWDRRNVESPGIITDIFVVTRITLTEDLTLENGLKFTRFAGDADRSTSNTDYLFYFSNHALTINDATIHNGTVSGNALYSDSNGRLTLNDGATVLSGNTSTMISNYSNGTTVLNEGSTIAYIGTSSPNYCINSSSSDIIINGGTITTSGNVIYKSSGNMEINGGVITHTGSSYCINNYAGTTVINDCDITSSGNNVMYSSNTHITMNGGSIRSTRTTMTASDYVFYCYNSGSITINGGTVDGGLLPVAYSTAATLVLNGGRLSSTNTLRGTVYAYSFLLNGENVEIDGLIGVGSPNIESNFITITSPTVTQDYTIQIADGAYYAALVKSNPQIDLGPYLSRFTLSPKPGYALAAYANRGETNHNIVLYNPNGIYINDLTGNDSNTGASPEVAVKTLENAAAKLTPDKSFIYICDSTLTINNIQTVTPPTPKDTISPFMFGREAVLIRVMGGGALTLGNIAVFSTSPMINRLVQVENGASFRMNAGAVIFTYGLNSTNYSSRAGIYQTGGSVVLNSGAKIAGHPTLTTNHGTGIMAIGSNATLTIGDNVIIEKQNYQGLHVSSGATATVGAAIIQNNSSTAVTNAVYVNGATLHLNGTVIQDNNFRAMMITGIAATVNMTGGLISNNGLAHTLSTVIGQGAVSVENQSTFNFSGGTIEKYYKPANNNTIMYGEMVYITSGAKMNFTGGTVTASGEDKNAIYVHASGLTAATAGRLSLNDQATVDVGYIYCSSPYFAPITLNQTLDPSTMFNINLGDNMAGSILVDGTSAGAFPAVADNFTLNPQISGLSLQQSGDDVLIASSAIYLDGVNGNDINDGSASTRAVRTFTRARERLLLTAGNEIIIVNAATLSNAGESTDWDLSFNPDAVVRRGLGYAGVLVTVASSRALTLSDITFDGNKENVSGSSIGAIINVTSGGTLTVNSGAVIRNNHGYGINNSSGSIFINGGEVSGSNSDGIYCSSSTSRSDRLIMTGGVIKDNNRYGINTNFVKSVRILGGEIRGNVQNGIYGSSNSSCVWEIGGTAKIIENKTAGILTNNSYLDSLIISGGEISRNAGGGIGGANTYYVSANHVLMTGGVIADNGGYGINIQSSTSASNTSCTITDVTIENNGTYGLYVNNYGTISMTGGVITGHSNTGITFSGNSNNAASVLSVTGGSIYGNGSGLYISSYANSSIEDVEISNNGGYGISVTNFSNALPSVFSMKNTHIHSNNGYGITINNYVTSSISGKTLIAYNKNSGVHCNSLLPVSITDDVLIKGNRSASNPGGIYINQGTVNISGNVTLEADTSNNSAGGIFVSTSSNVTITGDVKIKDCVNMSSSTTYGGSAIYASGVINMTGGSITGCQTASGSGTVYVSGSYGNVTLNRVTIRDNTANYGGAIYVGVYGTITLDSDTITNNVTKALSYVTPVTGAIHMAGGVNGRLSLRDKNLFEEQDIYISSNVNKVYIDEALLHADVGDFRLLANKSGASAATALGTVVVSPNGTTVTDASQFLTSFTLMNHESGLGLDKGGAGDNHIMIVNEFFIDGTKPANGNGGSPATAFNSLTQPAFLAALNMAYTTVWVSGPVKTVGDQTLPVITKNNVNLRRYTGFAVTAQPYPAYDSVMITIEPGTSLTIQGGNSAANTFTISGEGGSALTDASIFKNYGTLTIGGYTNLYFNPTAGNGAAVNQHGTFNLSGNVDFNLYSSNTVYLAEDKVINITGPLATTTPIGVTVETSPTNTHISGRVIVTGSATNIPSGMENLFYNEITPHPLPIGRFTDGVDAGLMFYIADRNVAGVPIYTKLQDAFDAAVPANNDEVRLYGNTTETVIIDKRLRYNSKGYTVQGSFTLDSLAQVQMLDDLIADTLYIRATVFSNKALLDLNNKTTTISEAAYLDLRLPAEAAIGDWYPVNLPFEASVSNIRDAADTTRQVLHLQDFGIAAFDGQRRANYGIGNQPSNPDNDWQFFTEPVMANGKGYMVTTDHIETLRFKAANLNLFATFTAPAVYSVGPASNIHHGINYLSQPLPMNAVIAGGIPTGRIIQVSEDLSSDRLGAASYVAKSVSPSLVIAPYTNYFYQTEANSIVSYATASQTKSDNAEWKMQNGKWKMENEEKVNSQFSILNSQLIMDSPLFYELRLSDDARTVHDALFVAASAYASKERYEIGRDVVKMGTIGNRLQLWSMDFDVALCANEALMEDGLAHIPLYIHTPVAGKTYHLILQNKVSDSETLWLYHFGKPIQNLTTQPEFWIEGTGRTTDEYSLLILRGTTSNKPVETGEIYVYSQNNTIIINGLHQNDNYFVYDLSGRLHANGKATGSITKIKAVKRTYAVQTNGVSYMVVVN